jgi:NAD(P)-dependent dehydrogenase (short-subunit alcohol dehydrogenase family)
VAEFKRIFGVNVFGAFVAIQAFFPLVKVRHPGSAQRLTQHCVSWRPQMYSFAN